MEKLTKRVIFGVVLPLFLLLLLGGAGAYLYNTLFRKPLSSREMVLYITSETSLDALCDSLAECLSEEALVRFKYMAKLREYSPARRPGHYVISPQWSANQVVGALNGGLQTPVKVIFNNMRTTSDLSERIAEQLYFQTSELDSLLNDTTVCAQYGFTPETVGALFIPDTYEFYWSVTPAEFLKRMARYYDQFWNESRLAKASEAGLSPLEVTILASIVEEETKMVDEMSVVAGLYLNRLNRGMLLQADPTVKFALQEFELKRILLEHLKVDSPYNTYKYGGLPPGPIRIPSKAAIESVLNYAHHNYLYMCAKEDFSGRHNFARTLAEHARNAARYHQSLSRHKIR